MTNPEYFEFKLKFPGDLDYIPSVRKFISEILQVSSFSQKFAYRTEIIVDEICNNAVTYGCLSSDAKVELVCKLYDEHIDFTVKDPGGNKKDIKHLEHAVKQEVDHDQFSMFDDKKPSYGLGLEIVRMLSEDIKLEIDDNAVTSIRVIRRREEEQEKEYTAKRS